MPYATPSSYSNHQLPMTTQCNMILNLRLTTTMSLPCSDPSEVSQPLHKEDQRAVPSRCQGFALFSCCVTRVQENMPPTSWYMIRVAIQTGSVFFRCACHFAGDEQPPRCVGERHECELSKSAGAWSGV